MGTTKARQWRVAASLEKLRNQLNAKYPNRNKASDGTIGDAVHASRDSDHNPWIDDPLRVEMTNRPGVVTALDVTDEPATGCDGEDLAALLRASRDPRIKYLIFNGRICRSYAKPGIPAWEWAPYTGKNAHVRHVHISVGEVPEWFDDARPWKIGVC